MLAGQDFMLFPLILGARWLPALKLLIIDLKLEREREREREREKRRERERERKLQC